MSVHLHVLRRRDELRIGDLGDLLEQREVGDRRDEAADEQDRLAADLVRQPAEEDEERRADEERQRDEEVRGRAVDLQRLGQEEQRVELARVPDDGLAGGAAEERDRIAILALSQRPKASVSGAFEPVPSAFIFWKAGDSASCSRIQIEKPSRMIDKQERDAPAPGGEGLRRHAEAQRQDDDERQEQADGRGRLDPGGVEAAPALRARARRHRSRRRHIRRRARGPAAGGR